jgi:hypothetical protein
MSDEAAATTTTEAVPAAQPTEAERMQAAIDKGKAAKPADEPEEGAEGEKPKPEGEAADKPETEAKTVEAETEEAKPEDDAKTKRGKEWAAINRIKQAQATKERELKRERQELTQTRADLQTIQQELVNLNKLRNDSPKKFLEALAGGSGGMRKLFEDALQEEKRTPEEEEKLSLKRELDELKTWRKQQEEAAERWKKDQESQQSTRQTREWHEQNYTRTQSVIGDLVKEGGYPNVAALVKTGYGLKTVAGDIYNRILGAWQDGKGRERPIPEVLDDVEAELAKEAGEAPDTSAPSERANGAEPTAKPEARPKRTPPSLTSAQASARASAGRELKGEERKRYFASMLRTRHE